MVADVYEDLLLSETPEVDEDRFTFSFEMPARCEDAPKPTSRAVRRLDAEDGEHWFDVIGGGTQVETAYLRWLYDRLATAVKARRESALDDEAYREAQKRFNAGLATFIGDRVIDHNLTDFDGNKLPLGLALFWELRGDDAQTLAAKINHRPSVWSDPKADKRSTTG